MRAYRDVNLSQHTSEYLMCAYRDTNLSQHTSAYVRQVEMHAYRDVNLHTHPLMARFFFSLVGLGLPRKKEGFLEKKRAPFLKKASSTCMQSSISSAACHVALT